MQDTQPLRSTAFTLSGMLILGFVDNTIPLLSADTGLWLFHALRSSMVVPLLALAALLGLGVLRARNPGAVLARNFFTATALLIYFGCLAFLPIGVVVAGLFTAPIFVLLISVLFRGQRVGPFRWFAVAAGFAGVLLIVWPDGGGLTILSIFPVVAGMFYAVGAVATRAWCEGEDALVMVLGYFLILGVYGALGVLGLTIWPQVAPPGPEGWLLRGWVAPDAGVLFWTFVQAFGSVVGVVCLTRGYQLGEASFVAINEYSLILFAAVFAWIMWGQVVGPVEIAGMALIVASGVLIALRSRAAQIASPDPMRPAP
ncbi:DMT family transporter [Ponticoccus sp. SC2-23]|uniref:DMT family transporter n=1 Tax=Alexandriicola marinus TaxID=2081710 RepID=UPI000FDCA254|nr:DMT family transporter [Alexandriicola marinus]MBM1219982.1 DMT family transporter [Ponticoccus sp. SC6-9]MBM1224668.1 DMT family transporter [Ponticoccus sp. SC6-15]MBM1228181.1 DMT family transporter [Ponticoccus sp. SC6-38]MBM1234181.1 DMT family transporter [Ponticoccus sp. SC6-45]MBM1238683.1 DMT family transporter [Ponticoccus sp. SC6-49]MBM1242464.1 DMT family transporter [Ponticoccus sp. SC2-64]MBM1247705.1 DMT family transporter [Ponticoccus sp. SC6-42]MBM1251636.1 DMT family tr